MQEFLANGTNPYLLPSEYLPFYERLNLDWEGQRALNESAGTDFLNWNSTALKQVLTYYIDYHNAVAMKFDG